MGECLSHLQLARFKTDDLSVSEARAVQAHLDQCEKCGALLRRMDASAAAYSAREELHLERLAERMTEAPVLDGARPWGRRAAIIGGLAAAAAAIFVLAFAVQLDPAATEKDPAVAFKGSFAIEVTAARDNETFAVKDGVHLRAGDAVRFAVTADRPGYLTVFSVDGNGATSPFYPSSPLSADTAPLEIPSAGKQVLPGSIVLDDAPGPERFIAVFSEHPFDRRAVVDESVRGLKNGTIASGPSIWVQSVVVEKETASRP